jgi:hypothetical protein
MIVKGSFDFRIILDCQEMDSLWRIQCGPDNFIVVPPDLNFHAPAAYNSTRAAANGDTSWTVLSTKQARISEKIVGVQADETTRKAIDQVIPVT